jgi:hypothetical protein
MCRCSLAERLRRVPLLRFTPFVKPLEAAIVERTLRTFRLPPALSLSAPNNDPQRNGAECGKAAEGR